MRADIRIKGIDNLTRGANGWSGMAKITVHSDIGDIDFLIGFQKVATIEEGIQFVTKTLASFGESLSKTRT